MRKDLPGTETATLRGMLERMRSNLALVLIFVLLSVVVLLSLKVCYLSRQYKQAQNEIQSLRQEYKQAQGKIENLTESLDNTVLTTEISEGQTRLSLESDLWNVQDELRRCHLWQKQMSRRDKPAKL
jgi:peptidoglycan hydrolase CwlO-like protein